MAAPPSGTAVLSAEALNLPSILFPETDMLNEPGVFSKPVPLRKPTASTTKPDPATDFVALERSKLNPPTDQKFGMLVLVKTQGVVKAAKEKGFVRTGVKSPLASVTESLPVKPDPDPSAFQDVIFVAAVAFEDEVSTATLPLKKIEP